MGNTPGHSICKLKTKPNGATSNGEHPETQNGDAGDINKTSPTKPNGAAHVVQTSKSPQKLQKSSTQSPRLWGLRKMQRKTSRKGEQAETDQEHGENCPQSPLVIRQLQLQQMQDDRPKLSPRQLELLSDTWEVLQTHSEDVGRDMFIRLFETYPDVKGAFGPFKTMAPEDIRMSEELRAHGQRVLTTIGELMKKRDDMSAVVTHLHELGQRHVSYNVKVDYIDIVGQQFLFSIEPILKEEWTAEVEQAWADLFRLIAHLMREAMML